MEEKWTCTVTKWISMQWKYKLIYQIKWTRKSHWMSRNVLNKIKRLWNILVLQYKLGLFHDKYEYFKQYHEKQDLFTTSSTVKPKLQNIKPNALNVSLSSVTPI